MSFPSLLVVVAFIAQHCLVVQPLADLAPKQGDVSRERSTDPLTCIGSWLIPRNGTCECGVSIYGTVLCDQQTGQLELTTCQCMTPDHVSGQIVMGSCIYTCVSILSFSELRAPAPTNCSGLHRRGTLCAECDKDIYAFPRSYSYDVDCMQCSHPDSWWLYLTEALLPLTVFMVIVIVCRVSVVSPQLRLFVFLAQVFSAPTNTRLIIQSHKYHSKGNPLWFFFVKVYMAVFGVWNLDFFRTLYPGVCLHLSQLQVIALDYIVAVYPMLLMIVAYILVELHDSGFKPVLIAWRPLHYIFARFRSEWNIQTTLIDVFVTFFVLSTTKLFSVSFDLLTPVLLHVSSGESFDSSFRLYYNANIVYLGQHHLPYALLALATFSVFILFPFCILTISSSPCLKMCLKNCRWRVRILEEFLYAFRQYYKNGTNGSADHRWYAALYIIVFFFIYLAHTIAPSGFVYYASATMSMLFAVLVLLVQPYKEDYAIYNKLDCIQFLWLALFCICIDGVTSVKILQGDYDTLMSIILFLVSAIPLVYLNIIVLRRIYCKKETRASWDNKMEESLPHRISCSHEYKK